VDNDLNGIDSLLWDAWSEFCDQLRDAGRLIIDHNGPPNPQNRAAGFEYLARYVPKALDVKFNNSDSGHPQLFWLQTPTSKSFGDNPDCTYIACPVDGTHTYRLVGNRGTAKWVSFVVGSSVINNRELETNWDGSFEIVLSAKAHPGNWLRLGPGNGTLVIWQFFGSWHEEQPMRVRVECLDVDAAPGPPTPADVAHRLHDVIEWLRRDVAWWSRFINFFHPWPNEFVGRVPDFLTGDGMQQLLNRRLSNCRWVVEADEALIVSVRPPACAYWHFELGNEWMNSVDYRYRLSSLNSEQAVFNPDGTVVIVLAHEDPGVPNWLDLAGYTSGLINSGWIEPNEPPLPQTHLVKFADLDRELPWGTLRIRADWRREQLRLRKIGVDRRFPT
jgi:hypothetical protein